MEGRREEWPTLGLVAGRQEGVEPGRVDSPAADVGGAAEVAATQLEVPQERLTAGRAVATLQAVGLI